MPDNRIIPQKNSTLAIKLISIVFFIAIVLSIIIMHDAPATGYEASIYDATPAIALAIIFLSIAWGIIVVVQQVYSGDYKADNTWMIGYGIVYLCYIIVLCLYIIRGYGLMNIDGDGGTHISYIQQILATGSIPEGLIYPITHVYTAIFSMVSSLGVLSLYDFIPFAFYIFYIPLFYLFAREILPEKGQAIIASLLSLAFLEGVLPFSSDHIFFLPNMLANALLPALLLVYYKFLKTSGLGWGVLLFAMLLFFPIFHPLPTAIFIIFILALPLTYIGYRLLNRNFKVDNANLIVFNAAIFLVVVVWLIQWISNYWNDTVASLLYLLFYGGSNFATALGQDTTSATTYGYGMVNVAMDVIRLMGGAAVFVAISVIGLPVILKHLKNDSRVYNVLSLYGPILFMGIFMVILYFSNIGFGPLRIVEYIGFFCTIIVGYLIFCLIEKAHGRRQTLAKLALCGFVILLVAIFINGIFSVYPATYTLESSVQTTQQELKGMDWIFTDGNYNMSITGISLPPFRFADALLTPAQEQEWDLLKLYPANYPADLQVPYHFGYDNSSSLAGYFNTDLYMFITQMDYTTYTDLFPDMAKYRFEPGDFDKLQSDKALDEIYSNNQFDVWYYHLPQTS